MAISGYYSDGLTAGRRSVELRPMGATLHVCSADREIEFSWHGPAIRLLEEVYDGQPFRLSYPRQPDAVITVPPQLALEPLLALNDSFRRRLYTGMSPWRRVLTGSVLFVVAVAGLLIAAPGIARLAAERVPAAWSDELGEHVADTLIGDARVCSGEHGYRVLTDMATAMAATNGYEGTLRVRVVDDATVNAAAAPGGQIVIYRGIVDEAESSEEFAGVLAHELGHVVEGHALQGVAQQLTFRFILGSLVGDASAVATTLAAMGATVAALSYSRDMEARADELAVSTLNRTGISAAGLARFFERQFEQAVGHEAPDWLSSHPLRAERIALIRAMDLGGGPALDEQSWHAVRQICRE